MFGKQVALVSAQELALSTLQAGSHQIVELFHVVLFPHDVAEAC